MICLLAVKTGMPRVYPNILYVYIPENRWAFIVKVLSLIVKVFNDDMLSTDLRIDRSCGSRFLQGLAQTVSKSVEGTSPS